MMLGGHLIHHWSSTQSVVALSSAEAELNGIVKGAIEGIGLQNMLEEMGYTLQVNIFTDSSAANGVVHRQGAGKVKHLECRQLWVQSAVSAGKVTCSKIPRDLNPSDSMTHYWGSADGSKHFQAMNIVVGYRQ